MDYWMLVLVFCVSIVLFYLYDKKKKSKFKDLGIPQIPELPFLGIVCLNLVRRLHMADLAKEWYNLHKNAKYVVGHVLMAPIVIVRDTDLIKTILVKDFDSFADRKSYADEVVDPLLAKNLVSINGDQWRAARTLLSPAFTGSKMKIMFELMSKCADKFSERFVSEFADTKEIDMKDIFTKYTNDIIASCAFGIEVDSLENPKNEFYVYGRELSKTSVLRILIVILKFFIIRFLPSVARFFSIGFTPKKITKFFVNVIDTTIKSREAQGITRPDMLQLMMDAREKSTSSQQLDILDITAQAFIFFAAGFEPTAVNTCLIAHEIASNPSVQEKLQAEIDSTSNESNGKLTYDQIANMPYLDAVFQETMRKHPQTALLSRTCSKTYELPPTLPGSKPYLVTPGTDILVPVVGVHNDPAFYDDPEKFDPDRFIGKKVTSGDFTMLGFGIGPRMCIGNRFAILETKVLFIHLLSKCVLQPCAKTCIPLKYSSSEIGPVPKEGFWLQIKRR